MDVAQVQKINALALDLLKQGLATDREDAVHQAEKVFLAKSEGYQELRQTMGKADQQVVRQNAPQAVASLTQEQLQGILEQNSQFLVKTIKEFQEKLAALQAEITVLRNRQTDVIRSPAAGVAASAKPAEKAASNEPHPRLGNYKNEDVSIEKFFNYSHKR